MYSRLVDVNGTKKIEINGKIHEFCGYRSFRPKEENIKNFHDRGFEFMVFIPSGVRNMHDFPYSPFGEYWQGDGVYDWDILRKQIDQFLENAPNALLAPMLMLDTRDWFLAEHPDCPNSFKDFSQVAIWDVWRDCAMRMVFDTIDFLQREYPENIFAIILTAGGTCEWFTGANWNTSTTPTREHEAFQNWPSNIEHFTIPTPQEMDRTSLYMYRDPVKDKAAINYLKFRNELVTETINYFAKAVKEKTENKLLVGVASGYVLVQNLGAKRGVASADDVIRSPYVDLIISPGCYGLNRTLDGSSAAQAPMDTIRDAGKLMIHSIDNTTYCSNHDIHAQMLQDGYHIKHDTLEQSIQFSKREAAMAMAKNASHWWLDMYGCWFTDEKILDQLKRIREVATEHGRDPGVSVSEVAMLTDCKHSYYLSTHSPYRLEMVTGMQNRMLTFMGCPFDPRSVYDILEDSFPIDQYKFYYIPDSLCPSDEVRAAVKKLREHGASMLFCNASGALTDEGFSLEAMRDFTGMNIQLSDKPDRYYLLEEGIANDSGYTRIGGTSPGGQKFNPVLQCVDEELAYAGRDYLSDEVRFAVKDRENGKGFDAWSFRGRVNDYTLRPLAKKAGVFIYQEDSLPMYANSRMVAFYDHKGGTHKMRFPYKDVKLVDQFTGETHYLDGNEVEITFYPDECKIFFYEK